MRVSVDFERCQGNGLCVLAAPEVFDLDEDNMLQFEAHPDGDQADAVRDAVRTCPTNAIRLEEQ